MRKMRDVRAVRLDNNQVIWLQFDAPSEDSSLKRSMDVSENTQ